MRSRKLPNLMKLKGDVRVDIPTLQSKLEIIQTIFRDNKPNFKYYIFKFILPQDPIPDGAMKVSANADQELVVPNVTGESSTTILLYNDHANYC